MSRVIDASDITALRAKVADLESQLSTLHDHVMKIQQANLDRLNQWRNQEISTDAHISMSDALNGQMSKLEMFRELVAPRQKRVALETGTFRGQTTRYLASHFAHVVTFENDIAYIEAAREHCKMHLNISFVHGDSAKIDSAWRDIPIPLEEIDFAYLDAHWHDACPLLKELDFVLGHAPNALIFIDDFKIEDDSAYGFDAYPSMTLNLASIKDVLDRHEALPFYPARLGVSDTYLHYSDVKPRGTLVVVPRALKDSFYAAKTVRIAQ